MAMFEFRLPDIGEGIAEGEVVAWHVTPGQDVIEDQEMVEVMTDKATVTIGCPRKGRIAQLNTDFHPKSAKEELKEELDDLANRQAAEGAKP